MGNELIYSLTILRFRKYLFVVTCQLDLARKKNKYINNYRLGTKDDQTTFQLVFFSIFNFLFANISYLFVIRTLL